MSESVIVKPSTLDNLVRGGVPARAYAGYSRRQCDRMAELLCLAAIRTGCFVYLGDHLGALASVARWERVS